MRGLVIGEPFLMELHLFDFDGTLFRAPDRPEWWGHDSWLMSSSSLGPPCVPKRPGSKWWVVPVVSEAKKSINDPGVWAILCTGRSLNSSHRYRIPELLKQKGLYFDEVYLNPGQNTKSYKIKVIYRILRRYPEIGTVQIWEDHLSNLGVFCRAVNATGRTCIAHPVRARWMEPICTELEMQALEEQGWFRSRRRKAILTPQERYEAVKFASSLPLGSRERSSLLSGLMRESTRRW